MGGTLHTRAAKTWIAVGSGAFGIALTALAAFVGMGGEKVGWTDDAGTRIALLLPTDLVISAFLLLLGAWLLGKLTGDAWGELRTAIPAWLGVYYFAVGVAAVIGLFVWWLLGCLVLVVVAAAMVRWIFGASGLGCVLAVGMLGLVRVASLIADILIVRSVMPAS